MIHSPERGRIVDYLGTHQHLAVDIEMTVDETGGVKLKSGAQRFYEGPIAWFDDAIGKFRIEVNVHNKTWGPLFGYQGMFDVEWKRGVDKVPDELLPKRFELRE